MNPPFRRGSDAERDPPFGSDPVLQLRGVRKAFGDGSRRVEVLRGVDLDVGRGELAALVGRSGSGKSTLLNVIAGLEPPDGGVVRVGGVDLPALNDRRRTLFRRERIGIVFQAFNLIPVLSALDNVALPARLGGAGAEAVRRAGDLLERVGLADRADAFPDELSGGEQQRVATARALVNRPALVLADEPTGNLDAESAARILELLAGVAGEDGRTVLLVTHDPAAASRAGRVLALEEGRVTTPTAAAPTRGG
jgi:putative ABC transport system ATP-binding protein